MKKVVISIVLIFVLAGVVEAKDYKKLTFKVYVDVSHSSKAVKNKIESFIRRELRGLHDVVITDKPEEYSVEIVAVIDKTKSGDIIGHSLAYAFVGKKDNSLLIGAIEKSFSIKFTEPHKKILRYALITEKELITFGIVTGNKDVLRSACEDIVTEFDARVLEPVRKVNRQTRDAHK